VELNAPCAAIADFQIYALLIGYIKDGEIIANEFISQVTLREKLPEFLEELAQAYFENPYIEDEIIQLCIERNNSVFFEHLTFLRELSYVIRYEEHKGLKKKLSDLENELFENELELAFIKNERKQKKAFLQNFENQHRKQGVANYSRQSDSIYERTKTNSSDVKSILFKIAAIFIVALIPISLFFLVKNDGISNMASADIPKSTSDSVAHHSNNQTMDIPKIAETNQIINTSLKTQSWEVELLYEPRTNLGYAGTQTTYISNNIRISFLSTSYKIDSVLYPHINELKQAIENPKTNESLKNKYRSALSSAYEELETLQRKSNTFDLKQDSLLIWKNEALKRNTVVELFELIDFENQQKPIYILRIDNDFYMIKFGRGKLGKPLNRDDEFIQRSLYLR
jgi:hypothetical protein